MKAYEIMNDLFSLASAMGDGRTCDTIKAGDPNAEVSKVAVSMFATVDIVRQAKDWGAQLLITHEPTYHDHWDEQPVTTPVALAKKALIESPAVQQALREGEAQLEGDGRILLRPSGTEALIRVMVEAGSEERAQSVAESIAKIVESAQN